MTDKLSYWASVKFLLFEWNKDERTSVEDLALFWITLSLKRKELAKAVRELLSDPEFLHSYNEETSFFWQERGEVFEAIETAQEFCAQKIVGSEILSSFIKYLAQKKPAKHQEFSIELESSHSEISIDEE